MIWQGEVAKKERTMLGLPDRRSYRVDDDYRGSRPISDWGAVLRPAFRTIRDRPIGEVIARHRMWSTSMAAPACEDHHGHTVTPTVSAGDQEAPHLSAGSGRSALGSRGRLDAEAYGTADHPKHCPEPRGGGGTLDPALPPVGRPSEAASATTPTMLVLSALLLFGPLAGGRTLSGVSRLDCRRSSVGASSFARAQC
ncbi:MAG: hypothetical protein JWL71_430 [Acidobacteria bacterium]|nr:hypothetical protein [Acidobacteriota bacterium]